ncbi:hypothetical protein ACJX0J_031802, partial [Zea mays]
ALVADVGEEKSLVDDDVGGVLVGRGVGGALCLHPSAMVPVILNLLMILSFINFSRSSLSHVIEGHQILFVSGVLLTIGSKPTVQFFTKPKDHKCDSSEPDLCDSGCNG